MKKVADPETAALAGPTTPPVPTQPVAAYLNPTPQSFLTSDKVSLVSFDAYQDETGAAYLPGQKLVVKQRAHWNMDAIRNPQNGYIPPENQADIPTSPGMEGTTMMMDGNFREQKGPPRRYLLDISRVRICALLSPTEEAKARAMARPDESPIYDPNLGWVLVPNDVLNSSGPAPIPNRSAPMEPTATPAASPAPTTQAQPSQAGPNIQ
jgi:hypothetical protein